MSLREHLEIIKKQRGKLTAKILVDEARDPLHALHNRFEWDDSVAGESWRREQARQLIKEVQVTFTNRDNEPVRVRAFYAVPEADGYAYSSLQDLQNDPISKELVLRDMERDWKDLHSRYQAYEEFWSMIEEEVAAR